MKIVHKKSDNKAVMLDVVKYKRPNLRKVPKKTKFSTNKLERIFRPSKNEVLKSNDEKFVKWVMKQLIDTEQILKRKQNYNACALYLNEKNLKELNEKLTPMTWLNFSPTTAEELPDNLLGIDINKVIVDI